MSQNTTYQAPKLTVVGSFEAVTQGTQSGNNTDRNFPPNTPRGQLTFS